MKLFVALLSLTSAAGRLIGSDPMTWSNHTELTCQDCMSVITNTASALKTHEDLIETFAYEMCEYSSSQDECRTITMATVPFVVSQLVINFPPTKVCEQLNFCPKQPSWRIWG
jgi:hypothetical protein